MELGNVKDNILLGDDQEAVVPPSLLTSAPVMDISFHPKLPILAAGLITGEVEVYEYQGNETIKKPLQNDFSAWIFGHKSKYREDDVVMNYHHNNMLMHPSGGITSMEFTDDGSYLVTASSDRTISVLDCVSSRLVIHLTADDVESTTKKRKKLMNEMSKKNPLGTLTKKSGAGGGGGNKLKKKKSALAVPVNPHKFGISALNVCDENCIATGDDDGLIAVWDMRERKPVHVYYEHADYVSQLCYFTDVQELVSSSGDTCLGVFDMRGGKVREFSERRKDELSCFAFINSSGVNNSTFIPSIMCGTPGGDMPLWKYGSWRRPYDEMQYHPRECESIISFHGEDRAFNHNIVLTGACDGLVRVMQMYPLRRNLCQLSARDYSYSHANSLGVGGNAHHYNNSNFIVKKERGQEAITHMRVSHDSNVLAVCGTDNIIDFVDVRFLNNEKELDRLRGRSEQRHMNTLRNMERAAAEEDEMERRLQARLREKGGDDDTSDDSDSSEDSDDGDTSSDEDSAEGLPADAAAALKRSGAVQRGKRAREPFNDSEEEELDSSEEGKRSEKRGANKDGSRAASASTKRSDLAKRSKGSTEHDQASAAEPAIDYMEQYQLDRAQKRERVAATKWLKEEKRKKVNFAFEKRRRRVGGFFGDMINQNE